MARLATWGGVRSHLEVLHQSAINQHSAATENTKWLVYGCHGRLRSGQQTEMRRLFKWKVNALGFQRAFPPERPESRAAISFCNKTKVPLDRTNGLSEGDVKVRCGGG